MSDWTQERVAILIRLWNNNLTCAAIAAEIGVTRNAVIGKAGRIGLPSRPNPIKWGDGTPRPVRPRVARLKPVLTTPLTPMPKPVRNFAIHMGKVTECRWPGGDPKEPGFHFCEAKTEPGRPYCQHHCERAYQKPEQENTRRMAAE